MPLYEYQCRDCDTVFETRRPMGQADSPVACPAGHERVTRRLSVFATTGRAGTAAGPAPSGGAGPCGSSCGCC